MTEQVPQENTTKEPFVPMLNWGMSTPDMVQVTVTRYVFEDNTIVWCPSVSFMYEDGDEGCQFSHTVESGELYFDDIKSAVRASFMVCCFFTECVLDEVMVVDSETGEIEEKQLEEFMDEPTYSSVHVSTRVA